MPEKNAYQEYILIDKEYFIALVNDINAAKTSIDMETYIFANDAIGKEILFALKQASSRSVKIRLLVDGIGTQNWKKLQNELQTDMFLVKAYHPLIWSIFLSPISLKWHKLTHFITHINSRNHRKTCVIDNKIIYIGSANISESPVNKKTEIWHDITVKIIGMANDELLYAFNKAWKCLSFKERFSSMFTKMQPDPILRLNYSWKKRRYFYKSLLKKIDDSKKRIYITNAYFVPRDFLFLKLLKAAKRNIEVCIIIPKNSDVIGMSLLTSSFYYRLLKAGVTIWQHQQGILHTKLLIIDDWFCLGSSNLNYRSLLYDLEADVSIQTEAAKKALENQFSIYREQSQQISQKEIHQKTFFEKIAIKFLWFFRFFF